MFTPGIICLLGMVFCFLCCKDSIKFIKRILSVKLLSPLCCGSHCDTGRYVNETDTGFNFIYILTAIPT